MQKTQKEDLRNVRLSSIEDLPQNFTIYTDQDRKWYLFWNYIPIMDRYIFKEILYPFIISLSFFVIIFLFIYLQKVVSLLIGKGIPFLRILDYFGYLITSILPNTIPMACLMSGIMATGRLSGDSELTAFRASGLSFKRIGRMFFIFGFIVACFVGFLNFYLVPRNNMKMNEFNKWVLSYNPLLAVKSGQFSGDKFQKISQDFAQTLYAESVDNEKGIIKDIQIRQWKVFLDETNEDEYMNFNGSVIPMGGSHLTQIIFAKNGRVGEKLNEDGVYEKLIQLEKGFLIQWEKDGSLSYTNFLGGRMDYKVPDRKQESNLEINVNPETYSMPMLFKIRQNIVSEGFEKLPGLEKLKDLGYSIKGIRGLKVTVKQMQLELLLKSDSMTMDEMSERYAIFTQFEKLLKEAKKTLTDFNIEIHRRFALPLSCQFFFLLSFPLGFVAKRSGKGMGFTLAIIFLSIYYLFFIFGSTISYKDNIPDWIGPWSANIVIGIISIYILATRTDFEFPKSVQKFFRLFSFFSMLKNWILGFIFFLWNKVQRTKG